jgi:hypothetical protein
MSKSFSPATPRVRVVEETQRQHLKTQLQRRVALAMARARNCSTAQASAQWHVKNYIAISRLELPPRLLYSSNMN